MIRAWWHHTANVGDSLTPVLLGWMGIPIYPAKFNDTGKLLGVGSILADARENDVVWGSGFLQNSPGFARPKGLNVLALRGPLSALLLDDPCKVFGDPALLLPLVYSPVAEKKWKRGVVLHYAEQTEEHFRALACPRSRMISCLLPWKQFVDAVLECDDVVSSSLHGIVIAEAYGVPARWQRITDRVLGDGFKFRDYYAGTGREGGDEPIRNIADIWERLIRVLRVIEPQR